MRVSNNKAREYVQRCEEFKGSNCFAEYNIPNDRVGTFRYVVYSYGYHYPMYVAEWMLGDEPTWYENSDKFSRSTGKQRTQLHPLTQTTKLDTDDMKSIALGGIARLVYKKAIEHGHAVI